MKNSTDEHPKQNGESDRADDGSLFEKVVPDGIKRGFENLMREGRLKNVISDIKMPKEFINHMMSQVDETKRAALQVIGKEVRLFLERTNLSDELAKLLTQVSFEIKTEVRFKPNDRKLEKKKKKKQRAAPTPPPAAPEDASPTEKPLSETTPDTEASDV